MSVLVAEYIGQRTDIDSYSILPYKGVGLPECPFVNTPCGKLTKHLKPVCSVRKGDQEGELWIVCKNRLCSSKKDVLLNEHQINILHAVGQTIYGPNVELCDLAIKREEPIPVVRRSSYSADFVMAVRNNSCNPIAPRRVVLEMQGGGETSNTGNITDHISHWESHDTPTNKFLSQIVRSANTIETNAWRRQQEQFLIKGNIACQTGGGIVFCVGSLLYDYLYSRISASTTVRLNDLRDQYWTLCLICFEEDKTLPPMPGPIPLVINQSKVLFTNYISFVQILINQGQPNPAMFSGSFISLADNRVVII